ncbi:unnamed protein product [Tilletia controversa]|nr:unnamed protein product [Tilletia controversa]
MSSIVSSSALSADTAAALMDIDGADLGDTGGFADIDEDASDDEPTQVLMIVNLNEQLNARDIGLAFHAHFDPVIDPDQSPSTSGRWLRKVFTLHTLPGEGNASSGNTGKAFAVCSDIATAQQVIDTFEAQYLEADVDEGFRLKLPEDASKRLVEAGGVPSEGASSTDQLLICFASPTVFKQCHKDDTRGEKDTFAVQLDWGETRFSYRDPSYGVQCWNAAEELSLLHPSPNTDSSAKAHQGPNNDTPTPLPVINGLPAKPPASSNPIEPSPNKKRSRSAMIREELKSSAARSQEPITSSDAFIKALQQAKLDFIREQISYGVPLLIPPELQGALATVGMRAVDQPLSSSMPPPPTPIRLQGGMLQLSPGGPSGSPTTGSLAVATKVANGSGALASPFTPSTSAGLVAQPSTTPILTPVAPPPPVSSSSGPPSRFLPARPSFQTIEEAAKLKEQAERLKGTEVAGTTATSPSAVASAGTGAIRTVSGSTPSKRKASLSMVPGEDRKRSFSEAASPTQQRSATELEEAPPQPALPLKSRWDIVESKTQSQPVAVPNPEPAHKKVRIMEPTPAQIQAPVPQASILPPTQVRAATRTRQPSHRSSSGRIGSIPAPAQAPPSLIAASPSASSSHHYHQNGQGAPSNAAPQPNGSDPLSPLEVPSGMRLPAPMDGLTRSLSSRNGEVPRDFDFCNQERMLCLLCLRQFKSVLTLRKHVAESQLHETNLDKPEVRRAGAARLIQTYLKAAALSAGGEVSGPASMGAPPPAAASVSGEPSAANGGTTATAASAYRDRELERRAVFGHGGSSVGGGV